MQFCDCTPVTPGTFELPGLSPATPSARTCYVTTPSAQASFFLSASKSHIIIIIIIISCLQSAQAPFCQYTCKAYTNIHSCHCCISVASVVTHQYCLVMQVSWLSWQYTLTYEGRIILGHMPIPEYQSFLVNLKVRPVVMHGVRVMHQLRCSSSWLLQGIPDVLNVAWSNKDDARGLLYNQPIHPRRASERLNELADSTIRQADLVLQHTNVTG